MSKDQKSVDAQKKDEPKGGVREMASRAKDDLVAFRVFPDVGWLGGVCSGIAYRLGIPTWIVRLIWFAVVASFGVGVPLYLLLWAFAPNGATPKDYVARTGDE